MRRSSLTPLAGARAPGAAGAAAATGAAPRIVATQAMRQYTAQVDAAVPLDEPLFSAAPAAVVFERFDAFQTYSARLVFRNRDKVSRRFKVMPPAHPAFRVRAIKVPPGTSKVAAGMDVVYQVDFAPDDASRDIETEIVCTSERERFVVPVRAFGPRADLQLPAQIVFNDAPVKHRSEFAFTVRNTGAREARVCFRTSGAPFSVTPSVPPIPVDGSELITVAVVPELRGEYAGQLIVVHENGTEQAVPLLADAIDVNVQVERPVVRAPSTYIGQESVRTFKVFNRSDIVATFSFRRFATADAEYEQRAADMVSLADFESQRRTDIGAQVEIDSDLSDDELDVDQRALRALEDHVADKQVEIELNKYLFESPVFSMEPLEGQIWPNAEIEVTVRFHPEVADTFQLPVFLDVSGREHRIPVVLKAEGLGPKVRFQYDTMDAGSMFVNSTPVLQVQVENNGHIDAPFQLLPSNSRLRPKFQVSPSSGVLRAGSSEMISFAITPDFVGDWVELFEWEVQGCPRPVEFRLKGTVLAPTFSFATEELNFGNSSIGFVHTKPVFLQNSSDVPVFYVLRVPEDGTLTEREFEVSPSQGTLAPMGREAIQVNFTPRSIKQYRLALHCDIQNVGESVLELPIRSVCGFPEVHVRDLQLDFGTVFLRSAGRFALTLVNDSRLPARYDILDEDEAMMMIATYSVDKKTGVIPPMSEAVVEVTLSPQTLGTISLPMQIKISGAPYPPLVAEMTARCVGPIVQFDQASIDFRKSPVLTSVSRPIKLTNVSAIPAEYRCFMKSRNSVFSVDVREGVLEPDESVTITVTAMPNEALQFRDKLAVVVTDGESVSANVSIMGVGTALVCEDADLDAIDFGSIFTCADTVREFRIVNRGRKPQSIVWVNESLAPQRSAAKQPRDAPRPAAPEVVFEIYPEKVLLEANSSQVFVLRAFRESAGTITQRFTCRAQDGKTPKAVFDTAVTAAFVTPLLEVSERTMPFVYTWSADNEPAPVIRQLELRNTTDLPLEFTLKCVPPFLASVADAVLESGATLPVSMTFDTSFHGDRTSCRARQQLQITYKNHPQREAVELVGEVNFPNLAFDAPNVDFGSVLNDTEKRMFVTITNTSAVPAEYRWAFLPSEAPGDSGDTTTLAPGEYASQSSSSHRNSSIRSRGAAGVFDALPIHSVLQPGESEMAEFVFFGQRDREFTTQAICEVVGGPQYALTLHGEASSIQYRFDRLELDFGLQVYNAPAEKDFYVYNTGKVAFSFVLDMAALKHAKTVQCVPTYGTIAPFERQRVVVRFCPGVPDIVHESIPVRVAHFDPQMVTVSARGIFPRVLVNLPRAADDEVTKLMDEARSRLEMRTANPDSHFAVEPVLDRELSSESTITTEAENLLVQRFANDLLARSRPMSHSSHASEAMRTQRSLRSATLELSRYILDFGNIIFGQSRKRTVRITNNGYLPVSFEIDKRTLAQAGFSCEPAKVSKLPGFPEPESVDLALTFSSKNKQDDSLGERVLALPIRVADGPTFTVQLRVNVTLPTLHFSRDKLDFGDVVVGTCKTITVQLHNVREVPCEWTHEPVVTAMAAKDAKCFEMVPSSGTLNPGARCNVIVRFTPTDPRAYMAKLPIRITNNPHKTQLLCRASGSALKLELSHSEIAFDPIVPCSDGSFADLVVRNPTAYPIEFFCRNADQQFAGEEAAVQVAAAFGEESFVRVPFRRPGDPLHPSLMVPVAPADGDAAAAATTAAAASDSDAVSRSAPGDDAAAAAASAAPRVRAPFVLLYGPPEAGVRTQAALLALEHGAALLDVDALVAECASGASAAFNSDLVARVQAAVAQPQPTLSADDVASVLASHYGDERFDRQPLLLASFASKHVDATGLLDAVRAAVDKLQRKCFAFVLTADAAALRARRRARARHEHEQKRVLQPRTLTEDEFDELDGGAQRAYLESQQRYKAWCRLDAEFRLADGGMDEALAKHAEAVRQYEAQMEQIAGMKKKPDPLPSPPAPFDEFEGALKAFAATSEAITARFQPQAKPVEPVAPAKAAAAPRKKVDEPPPPPAEPVEQLVFTLPAGQSVEALHDAIVAQLPERAPAEAADDDDADSLPIPPPEIETLVRKPATRGPAAPPAAAALQRIAILTLVPADVPDLAEAPAAAATDAAEAPAAPEPVEKAGLARWIVPAGEATTLRLRFRASDVGTFAESLVLQICGGTNAAYAVPTKGVSAYPQISTEVRNVFMRRLKRAPASGIVRRRYIMSDEVFDFGPLLVGKPRTNHTAIPHPDNHERIRITNNGLFPCHVALAFRDDVAQKCFLLDPPVFDLERDETREVSVWAYPAEEKAFTDTLVCCVRDNPIPAEFALRTAGCTPTLSIDRADLVFDRLLLGKTDKQTIKLTNTSKLLANWKNSATLDEEFALEPSEGSIPPGGEAEVAVVFKAITTKKLKAAIKIDVFDADKVFDTPRQSLPVNVTAEAYDINVQLTLPKAGEVLDAGLDFGVVRVFDKVSQSVQLHNKGLYDVKFVFAFKRKRFQDVFRIEPAEGTLQPNAKQPTPVAIDFLPDREVALADNFDLQCRLLEPLTGQVFATLPIKVNVRSLFSKFKVLPLHGINFGPIEQGETSKRSFEVFNDGEFPFDVTVVDAANEAAVAAAKPASARPTSAAPSAKPAAKPPAKAAAPAGLAVGQFTITPSTTTIQPGASAAIAAEFASKVGEWDARLVVEISGRNPSEAAREFGLQAEGCTQSINTTDFASIFEEQQVLTKLVIEQVQSNVFGVDDNRFVFGPVLVNDKVQERFKITNTSKIPCDVDLTVAMKDQKDELVFEVTPAKLRIQSHESQYATVVFKPAGIRSFDGIFTAKVPKGTDAKSNLLSFALVGDGTLPQISVLKPDTLSAASVPQLSFGRTLIDKPQTRVVQVRNDGIIATTIRFDMLPSPAFSLQQKNSMITVGPGETLSFEVVFRAPKPEKFTHVIKLVCPQNQFENSSIELVGEGYYQDIIFDDLPSASEDLINFGAIPIGDSAQISFAMRNLSRNDFRIEWPSHASVSFAPSCAHLHAGATLPIVASFSGSAATDLGSASLSVQAKSIRYTRAKAAWDDTMKTVKFVAEQDAAAAAAPSASPPVSARARRVVEVAPEPAFELIDGATPVSVPLAVRGVIDTPQFKLSTTDVRFRQTMMLQTRTFALEATNTGRVRCEFEWDWSDAADAARDNPFSIMPATGRIEPGASCSFTVTFAPEEVGAFDVPVKFVVKHATAETPVVHLIGRSARPWCHFELEESDYLRAGRRDSHLPGPFGKPGALETDTRVLEFVSCGVKVRNTKRFNVVNPTSQEYEFVWENEDPPQGTTPFRCIYRRGVISPGLKAEMVFEFVPESIELRESFWRFTIPSLKIAIPFVLAGRTVEPRVSFDRTRVLFGALLTSASATSTIKIVNEEHLPFPFSFDLAAIRASSGSVVNVSPQTGVVNPHSEQAITVSFAPSEEKAYNFNVPCRVKSKPSALSLNVKGEGYVVHARLAEDATEMASGRAVNTMTFGDVHINETRTRRLVLTNTGRFKCDYSWQLTSHAFLAFNGNINGSLSPAETAEMEIKFCPTSVNKLDNIKAVLRVTNGPAFVVAFEGAGRKPTLDFSAFHFDFGPTLLASQGYAPVTRTLTVVNRDAKPVALDLTTPASAHLSAEFRAQVLKPLRPATVKPKPGSRSPSPSRRARAAAEAAAKSEAPQEDPYGDPLEIPITFAPREMREYDEVLAFEVNSLYTINVRVTGRGTPMRLELANASDATIAFGAMRIGKTAVRTVKLVNRSRVPLTFDPSPCKERFESLCLAVKPDTKMTLQPRETGSVDVRFAPTQRIGAFHANLDLAIEGVTRTMLVASGACHGFEMRLDSDSLPFGQVVVNSTLTRTLVLANHGELGSAFTWDEKALGSAFSITPSTGFAAPNEEVHFEVAFHPREVAQDIRAEKVPLRFESFETPLHLTLSGTSVAQPSDRRSVSFKCNVRATANQTITLDRKFDRAWKLRPKFDSPMWSGPDVVPVAANTAATFQATFRPLSMAGADAPHKATLFVPYPDGSAQLFDLVGVADPPTPQDTRTVQIKAKEATYASLAVPNWLAQPQRFKVKIAPSSADPSAMFRGPEFIDVPAHGEREFRLSAHCYKEGSYPVKVTFTNTDTNEYLYHDLTFAVSAPVVQGNFSMKTHVRQLTEVKFRVTNPLATEVTLTGTCDKPDVVVPPKITLAPSVDTVVTLQYMPLLPGKGEATVTLQCAELGAFVYRVALLAEEAMPERGVQFRVALGQAQTQMVRILTFAKVKADFAVSLESKRADVFQVDAKVAVTPMTGSEPVPLELKATFEPVDLGSVNETLIIDGGQAGVYRVPLLGYCTAPGALGPFVVKNGAAVQVPFKNVLARNVDFTMSVDSPHFQVKDKETVPAKKQIAVAVTFKPSGEAATAKVPVTAKLVVTAKDLPRWTFYLKGVF